MQSKAITAAINKIVKCVRVSENYIKPTYQTFGGVWTVNVWTKGDITIKGMDDGYTTMILAPGIKVTNEEINIGTPEMILELASTL